MRMAWLTCLFLAIGLSTGTPAGAQIKLGVAGPMTGPNAVFGEQMRKGAEAAAKAINAKGGIAGQRVEIVIADDVSDPRQGVAAANKLASQGVRLVVGHFNSGVTIPASEIYAERGMLMISPSATNPKVTERGLWNVFRVTGRDDRQGSVWADYAARNFKGKRVAILHDKTTYGQGLANSARDAFAQAGFKPVLEAGVDVGEKDYSAIVDRLGKARTDLLLWGGLYTEAALILRQLRERGLKTVLFSGDGLIGSDFPAIGGDAVIGTLMTFPPPPGQNPAAADIIRAAPDLAEGYGLYTYAAVQVFQQAAAQARTLDPRRMAEAMHGGQPFRTVLGDIAFDAKGDRTTPDLIVYRWQKGTDGTITYQPAEPQAPIVAVSDTPPDNAGGAIETAQDTSKPAPAVDTAPVATTIPVAKTVPVAKSAPVVDTTGPAPRRVALVIGNSAYRSVSQLPNTLRDADLIGQALRQTGVDDVTVVHDLDRAGMIAALKAFARKADQSDWAVIYYAGHGIEVDNKNYLIPLDAVLESDRDVPDEAVPLERVMSTLDGARKLKLVVLDACRNNPFIAQMRRSVASRSIDRGLSRVEPAGATLVVYSAKEGTTAADGDQANSPFALSLARRLVEPGVEINKIFRFVRQDVLDITGNRQEPYVYGSLPPADFFFVAPQ
ncbi:ABC transporter substrate-binding protein [Labrys sedimenti]|uniref:ABC transporter substrate-binding protein n=1 Tax=Labrys sedimenti TaxID=3106036 RepID=UPI002ACA52EF|nr:ABC transporter substrate-binding protein [Labrys sp. ZIDIC5]MDZ5451791.1 ABC transporter substrate-binding protein [Labrys sp. ZIDIC5]